jgi:hypothetical protein
MKTLLKYSLILVPAALIGSSLLMAEEEKKVPLKPIDVHAVKAATPPALDAAVADGVWATAPATDLKAQKGVNFDGQGNTTAKLQAAYDDKNIYLRVVYADPTQSFQRSPYVKQADGSWAKLKDPDDKGGDNNKFYEDKVAMIWNIDHSIFGFDEKFGCQASCHAGEPGKPYGNKYTEDETELGDIWHMKSVRTGSVGQSDNQYLDSTPYDKEKSPEAGRKSDAGEGGYKDVKLVDGKPEFMSTSGLAANKGGTYWLKADDKAPFDDSKFVAGDELASIMVAPFTGDRGVIKADAKWADGKWTVVFERPLTTASKFDVQFKDLADTYGFGISFFDNAQVRHAQVREPLHLVFDK